MDKRKERRQLAGDMVFSVHVYESFDDPKLEGEFIACQLSDFSGHGLHVLTETALVPETLLSIKIKSGNPVIEYSLRGEIRWTKIIENKCHMGILFTENGSADLHTWVSKYGGV
ncbi:MAG: PilZ domain-containing protein [Gammaproteobacteria bacterium]|nr:PilZ domain-containing protein [Gammaproteobacteria bacterium]